MASPSEACVQMGGERRPLMEENGRLEWVEVLLQLEGMWQH